MASTPPSSRSWPARHGSGRHRCHPAAAECGPTPTPALPRTSGRSEALAEFWLHRRRRRLTRSRSLPSCPLSSRSTTIVVAVSPRSPALVVAGPRACSQAQPRELIVAVTPVWRVLRTTPMSAGPASPPWCLSGAPSWVPLMPRDWCPHGVAFMGRYVLAEHGVALVPTIESAPALRSCRRCRCPPAWCGAVLSEHVVRVPSPK